MFFSKMVTFNAVKKNERRSSMNAETLVNQNSIQQGKRKGFKLKIKKSKPKKFNKIGFLITWGLAIVFAISGIKIIWSLKTTPEGASESTLSYTTRHLVGFSPETFKETFIFLLGSLLLISAVFCIFLGLKIVAQYIVGKKLKLGKALKLKSNKRRFRKLLSDKTSISE